jgi:hypothetical protein
MRYEQRWLLLVSEFEARLSVLQKLARLVQRQEV